jgi:hypothetical protein
MTRKIPDPPQGYSYQTCGLCNGEGKTHSALISNARLAKSKALFQFISCRINARTVMATAKPHQRRNHIWFQDMRCLPWDWMDIDADGLSGQV